jgi:hypothetical protein
VKSFLITLLFLFNFVFPKAGIKVGLLPITFGYGLTALLGIFSIFNLSKIRKKAFFACLAWIPFQLVVAFCLSHKPIDDYTHLSSLIIHFFIFPTLFYLVFCTYFERLQEPLLLKLLLNGQFIVALIGIGFFIYSIVTNSIFELPGLTTNFHDSGLLEESKCNERAGIYKLTSTYNNGNLYGICQLFFYPLFLNYERSYVKRSIVRLALILTLSRTIWVVLIIAELLDFMRKRSVCSFISLAVILLSIYSIDTYLSSMALQETFLLDSTLGGRDEKFAILSELTLLSDASFKGIHEIVYLGILEEFGILGLTTFLLGMGFPLIDYSLNKKSYSPLKTTLIQGVILYSITCLSDGAILLIPVMYFYFFITSFVLLSKEANATFLLPS